MTMKFNSPVYPNMEIIGANKRIKFVNGSYTTNDETECELLKGAGFIPINVEEPEEVKPKTSARKKVEK